MTQSDKTLFISTLSSAGEYLEYGLGATTLLACSQTRSGITVIESNARRPDAFLAENQSLADAALEGRLRIHLIEIGPVLYSGVPLGCSGSTKWESYINAPANLMRTPTVVMINGPFRIACTASALLNGHVNDILFDSFHRDEYRILDSYVEVVASAQNIVRLRRSTKATRQQLLELLKLSCYSPHDLVLGLAPGLLVAAIVGSAEHASSSHSERQSAPLLY